MPLPSLQDIYEQERKRFDDLKGKWVKIHTTDKDAVEGVWEDCTTSMNEAEHHISIWSVTLSNPKPRDVPKENRKPRKYIVLAEIAIIEVVEDEDVTHT